MNKLNPSLKHHLLIGLLLALWIAVFALIIKPFDDGTLHFPWNRIAIGFSLVAFLCYALLIPAQKWIYEKQSKWNMGLEISILLLFHFLYITSTYLMYKTPLYYGIYNFSEFVNLIMFKVALILSPIILFARNYVSKLQSSQKSLLTITGDNKLDVLRVLEADLICISNAHNYVEIFFLNNGQISSKMIRSTLKKMQKELKFLRQVHRSHLINPEHFRGWKNQNTLQLTSTEIPVSKSFKENVSDLSKLT